MRARARNRYGFPIASFLCKQASVFSIRVQLLPSVTEAAMLPPAFMPVHERDFMNPQVGTVVASYATES